MNAESTSHASRRPRRRAISAVLFIFPLVDLIAEDLLDFFGPGNVHSAIGSLPPHPLFHVLTPSVGFFGATAILGFSIAFGPYLRGERWAWWALLLADLAVILANAWGTLTIYVHSIANGIIPELWLPLTVLALAVLLSGPDFISPKRASC
jgi:hypothetical protein